VNPIYQARLMLSHLHRVKLAVGQDGRNRASLMPFRAKTGRNAPSTTKLIFGPAVWLRSLIKPGPGYGLAYIDWSAQEFGIAARLSGDQGMMDAYTSGDPYLSFAKRIKFVPADATKESHEAARDQVKVVVLATLYGMGPQLLSSKIDSSVSLSKLLLQQHRQAYPRFWEWSRAATDFASLYGCIPTVFGWVLHVAQGCKLGTLQNFPVQANGAEMLRLAVDLAVNEGAPVICPVHDAVLIESPLNMLGHDVALTRACMAQASRDVLNGFELRTDVKLIKHPERYLDKRGVEDWRLVLGVLSKSLHSKPGNVANQIPQIRECTKSNI
jgi:DNA polymerase-1